MVNNTQQIGLVRTGIYLMRSKWKKTMMGLLLMLIVAVAAFNIVSTLVMVVTDKQADIAIYEQWVRDRSRLWPFCCSGRLSGLWGRLSDSFQEGSGVKT